MENFEKNFNEYTNKPTIRQWLKRIFNVTTIGTTVGIISLFFAVYTYKNNEKKKVISDIEFSQKSINEAIFSEYNDSLRYSQKYSFMWLTKTLPFDENWKSLLLNNQSFKYMSKSGRSYLKIFFEKLENYEKLSYAKIENQKDTTEFDTNISHILNKRSFENDTLYKNRAAYFDILKNIVKICSYELDFINKKTGELATLAIYYSEFAKPILESELGKEGLENLIKVITDPDVDPRKMKIKEKKNVH